MKPSDPLPASIVLQRLHDEAPIDHFTLGWLMGSLHKRSFGIIMLVLAVVAIAPGISIVAGLLLMIPAFQMIMGQIAPAFPRHIAARPMPTQRLAALVQRAVPVLRYLEKVIFPRWPTPHGVALDETLHHHRGHGLTGDARTPPIGVTGSAEQQDSLADREVYHRYRRPLRQDQMLSVRRADGITGCNPVITGIGAVPRHQEHRAAFSVALARM